MNVGRASARPEPDSAIRADVRRLARHEPRQTLENGRLAQVLYDVLARPLKSYGGRSRFPFLLGGSAIVPLEGLVAALDFYEGRDPRDLPAYSFGEVAISVGVPTSTLRAWCVGQSNFKPVLSLPSDWSDYHALSFFNLIEANVIAELRREHKVPMARVRAALGFLSENVPVKHPLVEKELLVTPNQRVYIVHKGRTIDISAGGQWPLDAVVRNLLRRVHRGRRGIVLFFPRVAPPREVAIPEDEYAPIVVDPEVCFGRPVVAGTAIPTDVIADRYLGGDSVKKMAEDYDLSEEHIRAALRFERVPKANAA